MGALENQGVGAFGAGPESGIWSGVGLGWVWGGRQARGIRGTGVMGDRAQRSR